MFVWNETDFASYLGGIPATDDVGDEYIFTIERDGLALVLTHFAHAGDIYFSL